MVYDDITLSEVHSWHASEIVDLYRTGGWWEMGWSTDRIAHILDRSFIFIIAHDTQNRAVGMGRIIADGVADGYIQDVVVFPEYRGHGIGERIATTLRRLGSAHGLTWIGLISAPDKESIYLRAGFSEMKNYTSMLFENEKN
ncbi:MAG TPA: GNAT family N-acetyltransferase [Methanocorpusculum sp.]|nr:GNAT family N-acetyltransferase [Methanocorpusculum sp.]